MLLSRSSAASSAGRFDVDVDQLRVVLDQVDDVLRGGAALIELLVHLGADRGPAAPCASDRAP
jgi:hypothetical protein